MNYPHLASRVFNTPLLIHPQKLDAIIAGLGDRLLGSRIQQPDAHASSATPTMFSTRRGPRAERGYEVVDGVAVLSVSGALVHRSQFLMADSTFLVGYDDLAADLEDAMSNSDVHAVLQVYDTPGGEAQGAFQYADRVLGFRGKKPMLALCDGMALSAGYLSASAADEVIVTSTGYAGSVGVVMRHVDMSKALAADGVAVTHIFAGDHKVDGNPFEPLPEAVRADFQGEINRLMDMFVQAVCTHRSMQEAAVRGTQARTFQGVAAMAAGFADRMGTADQLITELAALRARSYPVGPTARSNANDKGASMSGTNPGGQQPATPAADPATSAFSQEHVERARAEGRTEGIACERERVSGIFALDAAAGRSALAIQCVSTGLSVEQAGAILGATPAAAAAASNTGGAFTAAMAAVGNPAVSGIEGGPESGAADEAALAGQVLSVFRSAR